MKTLTLVLCTAILGFSNTVAAGLLEIRGDDKIDGDTPMGAAHDVSITKGLSGWYNANLYAQENVSLTYEFLGFEAGWINTFLVGGKQVFKNKDSHGNTVSIAAVFGPKPTFTQLALGSRAEYDAAAGTLLDFAFKILSGGNKGCVVRNGDNEAPTGVKSDCNINKGAPNNFGAPNFFLAYDDNTPDSVFITLDDGGGGVYTLNSLNSLNSLDDDNHDDMVVRVIATRVPEPSTQTQNSVPEPSTLVLFALGLIGLGVMRRMTATSHGLITSGLFHTVKQYKRPRYHDERQ